MNGHIKVKISCTNISLMYGRLNLKYMIPYKCCMTKRKKRLDYYNKTGLNLMKKKETQKILYWYMMCKGVCLNVKFKTSKNTKFGEKHRKI